MLLCFAPQGHRSLILKTVKNGGKYLTNKQHFTTTNRKQHYKKPKPCGI